MQFNCSLNLKTLQKSYKMKQNWTVLYEVIYSEQNIRSWFSFKFCKGYFIEKFCEAIFMWKEFWYKFYTYGSLWLLFGAV